MIIELLFLFILPKIEFMYRSTLTIYTTIFFIALFLFSACNTTKKTTTKETLTNKNTTPLDVFLTTLEKNKLSPEWLSAKADVNYSDQEQQIGVNTAIILRKDSALLMAFRKFGFEAARVLVTKDSIFIINRLTSEYAKKPLAFIEQKFNLPANFNTVQSFVLGNPIFLNTLIKPSFQQTDSTFSLTEMEKGLEGKQIFEGEKSFLKNIHFQQITSVRNVNIALSKYAPTCTTCKNNFSYSRTVAAISPEIGEATIDLKFTEIELNKPKTMRFEIPANYRRMD
jgi:hypothetical protein